MWESRDGFPKQVPGLAAGYGGALMCPGLFRVKRREQDSQNASPGRGPLCLLVTVGHRGGVSWRECLPGEGERSAWGPWLSAEKLVLPLGVVDGE